MSKPGSEKGQVLAKVAMRHSVKFEDFSGGIFNVTMEEYEGFYRRRAWLTFLDWLESKRPR